MIESNASEGMAYARDERSVYVRYVRYGIICLSASPLSGVLPSVDSVFLSEHDSYRWASSAIGRL